MSVKLGASITCAAMLLVPIAAHGSAQRTFVASNGVDSNPCSIPQPCRSFGAAIGKTLAGGEVIVVDSAGYGPVTVTQPVSLIAPPGVYAGITVASGQTGVTVDAAGATVVLRGLSINGLGGSVDGVHVIHAARLRIEGCTISNLGSIGIVQGAAGAETVVLDTVVRDNGGPGFSMITDATAVFDNVRVEHNGGDGIYFAAGSSRATATIRRSVLSHNGQAGVAAVLPSKPAFTHLVIEDSTIANNDGDGIFAGGILDGNVEATVRRNTVASNAYSGISAYTGGVGGIVAFAVENTFSDHPTSHTKADGTSVSVFASRNDFRSGVGTPSFYTVNGASSITYQDNTGAGGYTGTLPLKATGF